MKLDIRNVGKGCNELDPYMLTLMKTLENGNIRISEMLGVSRNVRV